ncbi:MAG: protein kinase, partial [Candidatus Aminicenantes bacterium]|nr:protein kinase [Candidatus Aminicenantes bacterium]
DCGTHLQDQTKTLRLPLEELPRGSFFAGRYQIIEELGTGGMGTVYRALDTKIDEEIALKLIKPEIAADAKTIERFRNEMKLTRQIPHRNVCRMYDLGEEEGTCYITMEYVPGEDLKNFIRRSGQLTVSKATSIAKQTCEGLEEAHRLGVVHRDLKSSNIMIDKDGNVRIMDFGIARSLKKKDDTGVGVMVGTPEYMSPEQVESADVDHRADIYSLGIIIFEMLTGRVPFQGQTPVSIALMHRKAQPPNPRGINPEIHEELNSFILKCLEKNKEKRFQSAKETFDILERIERDHSTTERIVPKKTRTYKRPLILTALLLFVAMVITLGILYFSGGSSAAALNLKMMVVLPFENLGPPEDEYFADGITEEITSRLSALQGLGIISRTSARHYKQSQKSGKQVGEELGVDYVLEGTVQWDRGQDRKGRVRVTPQLICVSDDTQLWSERYDRVIEDIFSVQAEIAEQVAKQLDLTILAPDREALYSKPTDNLEAYNFYLKGKEHEYEGWLHSSDQEFERAVEMLDKATELDPDFVLAYTQKSVIHSRMHFFGADQTRERLDKAREALDKALELRPDLPDTQIALAFYHYWGLLDYNKALEIFDSVRKAQPNVSPELVGYIQRRQGKWEESLETLEAAFRLNPRYSQLAYEIGLSYLALHKYDQANMWFDKVLSINPNRLDPQLGKIAISVCMRGDSAEARRLLETLPPHPLTDSMRLTLGLFERRYQEILDHLDSLPYDTYEAQHFLFQKDLAYAGIYWAMGDFPSMQPHAERARILLEEACDDHPGDPRYLAALGLAYAYLGRKQEAVREGNRAVSFYPVSKDAAMGPIYVLNLARIYTIVGENKQAIEQLEYLLSVPSCEYLWHLVTVPCLRLDPTWDPLRRHLGFQQMLSNSP